MTVPLMPRSPKLITLIVLTMSTALSLNMFLPGLPGMAQDFDVSYATISLSFGGYLAVTAVLALLIGPLSDRIGRRPVVLGIAAIFAIASIAAALATTIIWFLFARFCQGVMVGGFILGSSIVRDTRPENEVASLLSYITASMALAPILAPIIGGFVVETLGWRAVFWLYAVMGSGLWLLAWFDVTETRTAVPKGQSLKATVLLKLPRFWALVGTVACSNSGFYVFLAGTPIVALAAFGFSGGILGMALGSITVGFLIGSTLGGRLTKTKSARFAMIFGRVLALLGLTAGLASTGFWPDSPLALFGATVFIGLGNGLTVPSTTAMILSLRPELAGTAMGFAGSSVVGTGAITTTLTGALLSSSPNPLLFVTILWTVTALSLILALIENRL